MLYNGVNTKALRETQGRFSLKKLLKSKRSLVWDFYNQFALTVTGFCLLICFVSYISTFSQTSSSNFLSGNPQFPKLSEIQVLVLYFLNCSVSVNFLIPVVRSISNFLQFREVENYNALMQAKKEAKLARIKARKLEKLEQQKKAEELAKVLKS